MTLTKLKEISVIASLIVIPIAVSLVSALYAYRSNEGSLNVERLKLSIKILSAEPSKDATDTAIREWAVKLLNSSSPNSAKLTLEAKESLTNKPLRLSNKDDCTAEYEGTLKYFEELKDSEEEEYPMYEYYEAVERTMHQAIDCYQRSRN